MNVQQPCKRDDLRVDAVMTVPCDDIGQPVFDARSISSPDYEPFLCNNCGDVFWFYHEALAHFTGNAQRVTS